MKTIVLVRHAKSSWKYDVGDKERPLKKRGVNDALIVSNAFKTVNFRPDIVLSSPANRAFSTCKIFLKTLEYSDDILKIEEGLYDFGGYSVVNCIKAQDDIHESLMIFGHNHAFTSISNTYGSKYIDNLPTAGLVMINIEIDSWKELKPGITALMLIPSELKNR
jgi:phosphohistidine phosphatase